MSSSLSRVWIFCGALNGLAAVALAAVAAHAGLADERVAALRSGMEIQAWHAAVLLFCGVHHSEKLGGRLIAASAAAFVLGSVLFCTGVYAVAFAGLHLGPVAPTGGVILMLGWVLLATDAAMPTTVSDIGNLPQKETDEPPSRLALFIAVGIAGLIAFGGGTWFALRPVPKPPTSVIRPNENVFRPPVSPPFTPAPEHPAPLPDQK